MTQKKASSAAESKSAKIQFGSQWLSDPVSAASDTTQVVKLSQFSAASDTSGTNKAPKVQFEKPNEDGLWLPSAEVAFGVLTSLEQTWRVKKVLAGDLLEVHSLSPRESVELTVERRERTVLERTEDNFSSRESTTEDTSSMRESLSVTKNTTKTRSWGVSGNLGIQVPDLGLPIPVSASADVSADFRKSMVSSTARASESVTEATKRSSETVKLETRVVVKSVSETSTLNRKVRHIENPRDDAVLHLWHYELLKRYEVVTAPTNFQFALSAMYEPINFNDQFLVASTTFLQDVLGTTDLGMKVDGAVRAAGRRIRRNNGYLGKGSGSDLLIESETIEAQFNLATGLLFASDSTNIAGLPSFSDLALSKDELKYYGTSEEYRDWVAAGIGTIYTEWRALGLMNMSKIGTSARAYWNENWYRMVTDFASRCRKIAWDSEPIAPLLTGTKGAKGVWSANPGSVLAQRIQLFLYTTTFGLDSGDESVGSAALNVEDERSLELILLHLQSNARRITRLYIEHTVGRDRGASLKRWIDRLLFVVGKNVSSDKDISAGLVPAVYGSLYDPGDLVIADDHVLVPIRLRADLYSAFFLNAPFLDTLWPLRTAVHGMCISLLGDTFLDRWGAIAEPERGGLLHSRTCFCGIIASRAWIHRS